MKVFISYSVDDRDFVTKIAEAVSPHAQVYFWDKSKEPGTESWPAIHQWIDESDLVLVVITGNAVKRALSIGQEIGRAKTKGKFIIPLVEEGIPSSALGNLAGITYEPIPKGNPSVALERVKQLVQQRKVKNDENAKGWLAVVVIVSLALLVFSEKEK